MPPLGAVRQHSKRLRFLPIYMALAVGHFSTIATRLQVRCCTARPQLANAHRPNLATCRIEKGPWESTPRYPLCDHHSSCRSVMRGERPGHRQTRVDAFAGRSLKTWFKIRLEPGHAFIGKPGSRAGLNPVIEPGYGRVSRPSSAGRCVYPATAVRMVSAARFA